MTPLAFIMRAVLLALDEFPVFGASLSADGKALVVKKYRHLGFAADTPNGLVVPVVKDADRLDVFGLAKALAQLRAARGMVPDAGGLAVAEGEEGGLSVAADGRLSAAKEP